MGCCWNFVWDGRPCNQRPSPSKIESPSAPRRPSYEQEGTIWAWQVDRLSTPDSPIFFASFIGLVCIGAFLVSPGAERLSFFGMFYAERLLDMHEVPKALNPARVKEVNTQSNGRSAGSRDDPERLVPDPPVLTLDTQRSCVAREVFPFEVVKKNFT